MLPTLRIFGALFLLGGVIVAGWSEAPVGVIGPLAVVFTVCFGLGRWRAWVLAARAGGLGKAFLGQVFTLLIQGVLVAMFYLMGRGLAAVVGSLNLPFSLVVALSGYALLSIALSVLVALLEVRLPEAADSHELPSIPAREDNFFGAFHHSQADKDETENDPRGITAEQIAEEEARLGIVLPSLLSRLYMRQNGGSRMGWYAPDSVGLRHNRDGWIAVFSYDDDCVPLTQMLSLKDTYEELADSIQQVKGFDRIFGLTTGWDELLFLDYRGADEPKVGFVVFESIEDLRSDSWESGALWWSDFDEFFDSLRRHEHQRQYPFESLP